MFNLLLISTIVGGLLGLVAVALTLLWLLTRISETTGDEDGICCCCADEGGSPHDVQ